ncbi:MAG: FG-GAP repeat domain-containing protein, partial [Anaerolineae bacterium]
MKQYRTLIAITVLLTLWTSLPGPAYSLTNAGDQVTLHAAGRGNPWINLHDGVDLPAIYTGPATLTQALEENQAQPLSLAAGDFDEDGIPDLVSGYAGPDGGIVTLHRGSVDSIYPNSAEAQRRTAEDTSTESPYLSPARVFALPEPPEFLGTGDFDNDGHLDVVAAAHGSDVLHLLAGDGLGGFGPAEQVRLPGKVTALVTREARQRGGLMDLVLGIVGPEGPQVLLFGSPEGALRGGPEAFALAAEATALTLGQLDEDYSVDLAVAAGHELLIIHGRERRTLSDETEPAEVPPATIDQRSFPFAITSLAVGDFTGDHRTDLALLSEDGTAHLLVRPRKVGTGAMDASAEQADSSRSGRSYQQHGAPGVKANSASIGASSSITLPHGSANEDMPEWPTERTKAARPDWAEAELFSLPSPWSGNTQTSPTNLIAARVSGQPADDLVVVDPTNHQLHILMGSQSSISNPSTTLRTGLQSPISNPVTLDVEGEPAAVLPMRLNGDALHDLVIL